MAENLAYRYHAPVTEIRFCHIIAPLKNGCVSLCAEGGGTDLAGGEK
ncbi:hypothetical protein CUS_5220 [Ruminococcus albus 8]|uniref:Uncharacterized protein n=1 Tax=Ruminococcus albus 8 TaxID=246199 RepID=E9SE64_RUMAL|nr:hypothetical protein CUS_5220 [Ruminococcus albus 8]